MHDMQSKVENRKIWNVKIVADAIDPESGAHFDLVAAPEVRDAVARIAGLRELRRFEAAFDVRRHGAGGLEVSGRVSATVGQSCVVTLEPLTNEVVEAVGLIFKPLAAAGEPAEAALAEGNDDIEPLVNGYVDLGAIAVEFLLLGLDPYPRKPGALFESPSPPSAEEGPFAALANLRKGPDDA